MSPSQSAATAAQSQFSYAISIHAAPDTVWAAFVNPDIEKRIWLGHYIESVWRQGSAWRMLTPDGHVANSGEILELDRPRRLVLSYRNEVHPDWMCEGYSRAVIALEPESGMTEVSVVHTLDRPGSKLIAAASTSWPLILSNLKALLEAPDEPTAKPAVTFARHSKLTAQPSDQRAIRHFFRDVLGVLQIRESSSVDIFRIGPQFFMGVIYSPDAPTAEAMRNSIWLELATANAKSMKAKILAGGGREIEFRDKDHFYFQAPGGQVFRLISNDEDMSGWER